MNNSYPPIGGAGASVAPPQITAFGEASVAQKTPEIQIKAEYNSLSEVRSVAVAGATTGAAGGQFFASTGIDPNGLAAIFTDRQIISRPGQGSELILTAMFTEPVADSRQIAGAATASDGMLFGYKGIEFGVFFQHNGLVVIEELTITTSESGDETASVGVNGVVYDVDITSGTEAHNAFEIAASLNAQVPLYNFTQNGSTVVARAILDLPKVSTFTFSSPGTAVAVWAPISEGVPREEKFIKQSDWNAQAVFQQPVNQFLLNRYCIVFNGSVDYYIEDGATGRYVLVHREVHTNIETDPMFSIAAFRLVWGVQNEGGTTNLTVSGSEASAFNQGERRQITETKSAFNTATGIGLAATNILSIRCREVFGTKVNLGRIIIKAITAFTDGNNGAIVQVRKGVTFATDTNFVYKDKEDSIAEIEINPIEVSGGELISAYPSADPPDAFDSLILPGEVLTISMNIPSVGQSSTMSSSSTWEEDK